jgi:uncharacterized protein YcbX
VPEAVIKELWTYPLKGGQGVTQERIEVSKLGIPGDREFVVWCEGQLVDQKETPRIASIGAAFDASAGVLTLTQAERGEYVHRVRAEGERRPARWVLDQFETTDQGDEVAGWLSAVLDKEVRLVAPADPWKINFPIPQMKLLHEEEKRSFFAASPVSLSNQGSLDDLNARLEAPAPMDRFRMNVVVEGLDPFLEHTAESFQGDEVSLLQVTPAERCVIITTDQRTGERQKSDLLKRLPKKPKDQAFGSGRMFGCYLQVAKAGTLRVGERLRVSLREREEGA